MQHLIVEYKSIHDSIHGYISISNIANHIINAPEFQRLRDISQLGTCKYAFPNAHHNRFVHSIGTYHLAGEILNNIIKKTLVADIENYLKNINELQDYYSRKYDSQVFLVDEYICEMIKIAALCHDLGHGPFSHVFDDFFLPTKKNPHPNDTHEERSKLLLELIIKKSEFLRELVTDSDIEFMKTIISPKENNTGFLYQIVSNSFNGLDVDKFDYIARDSYVLGLKSGFDHEGLVKHVKIINNNLVYPERVLFEIKKMYDTRYSLHKQIYNHKTVVSSQLMMIDLFKILDPILNLSDSVENMEDFCKLTDQYILNSVDHRFKLYEQLSKYDSKYESFLKTLLEANNIINRLNTHCFYVFVGYHISNSFIKVKKEHYKLLEDFDEKYLDKIIIFQTKIGFVSGDKKNPLQNIYTIKPSLFCSNHNESNTKISIDEISLITPKTYQEYITMIYSKENNENDITKIKCWTDKLISLLLKE
ncbi:HD phosphohydrolase [Catovirus CTV1]|uniref:HD phosphohydrolase n=1 Tax=Catovirus CTV1 TaxID=1977631 RepID=A0A1V0SC67_9VIRU|nr:HD phosphohydrolase [Catovirus CTV1]